MSSGDTSGSAVRRPGDLAAARVRAIFYLIRSLHTLAHASYLVVFILAVTQWLATLDAPSGLPVTWGLLLVVAGLLFEVLFEPLTSQFADRRGRTVAVLLYAVLYLTAALCFSLPHTLDLQSPGVGIGIFMIGQCAFMLGAAFLSGTLEAWAVDSLQHYTGQDDFSEMFATASQFQNVMWLVGGMVSLFLFDFHPAAPWLWIAGLMILTVVIAAVIMSEPYRPSGDAGSTQRTLAFLRDAFHELRSQRNLLPLTVAFAGSYVLWVSIAYFWIPAYKELHEHLQGEPQRLLLNVKIAWPLFCLARLVGSLIAKTLAKKHAFNRSSLVAATLVNVLPILVLPLVISPNIQASNLMIFLALIMLAKIGEEVVKPIRMALLNQSILGSAHRATIISLGTFFGAGLATPMILLLYYISREETDVAEKFVLALFGLAVVSAVIAVPAYLRVRSGNRS